MNEITNYYDRVEGQRAAWRMMVEQAEMLAQAHYSF